MCYRNSVDVSNNIMAGLKIFVIISMVLVTKDGAFSCSLRNDKHDSTLQANKSPTSYQSILPSESTLNTAEFPDSVSKAQITPSPYALGSGSSSPSSILLNPPYGSVPSTTSTVLKPQLPCLVSTPTDTNFPSDGTKKDLINCLVKISPLVPSPSSLPILISTRLSPLFPLFTPTLNKNVNQGTKPCSISHPDKPSSSALSHGSSSPSIIPVPGIVSVQASEKFPALTPVPFLEHGLEIVPEEFPTKVPKQSTVPGSTPEVTSTSNTLSTFSGYNPDCVNYLLKLLLSYQAQTGSYSSLIPTTTPVSIFTSNAIPVSASDIKPHTISPACVTPPGSSSCSSSVLPYQSNGSISQLQQMLMSITPLPVSSISSGYNPEFMKLLIKNLLSNATSSLLPQSSLFPLLQSKLNTTSNFRPTTDTFPMSTLNNSLYELNPNVSSNNTFDLVPSSNTNQNISVSNNQILTNILIKLSTSNSSKTPLLPSLSSSGSHSISALGNTPIISVPCPPFSSLSVILSKFPSLAPNSKPSFPDLIPSPIMPLANVKQFPEQVKNVTPIPTLTPSSYPLSPSSNINLCRLKLKLPLKLSSLTPDDKTLCLKNIIQPHTPHLPSPCSLLPTKLSSGCKLLSPTS